MSPTSESPSLVVIGALALLVTACTGQGTSSSTTASAPSTEAVAAPLSSVSQPSPSSTTTLEASRLIDVTFPSEDLVLSGSLRLPDQAGAAPAVVLIHGSGPQNRDQKVAGQLNMGFGFEIPVFAELASGLSDRGIAVLTYDKRTCGPFNGCADNGYPLSGEDLVVDDFIADAVAAVAHLRSRPEVDHDRIVVVGHSQGAQFVTLMLEADPDLAAGVIVAGPYQPIDEIIGHQFDFSVDLLVSAGLTQEKARAAPGLAPLADMVDGLEAIRRGSTDPVAGASAAFWRSWFELHERALSAGVRVRQPILVLNGEMDWNVPDGEALAWGEFLRGFDVDVQVMTLPCVTHALNCVAESDPSQITAGDIGREVDPQVIDAIAEFILGAG